MSLRTSAERDEVARHKKARALVKGGHESVGWELSPASGAPSGRDPPMDERGRDEVARPKKARALVREVHESVGWELSPPGSSQRSDVPEDERGRDEVARP